MRHLSIINLALIALISCNSKKPVPLSAKIDSVMSTTPDFSGVVLIADQGKPVYFKSSGYQDYNTQTPLDTTTIFELASVSKQFTAMAIMMLQEDGKLNYDDSLKNFVPEIPYPGITIRHLLNHTSGLPDYQTIMDQYWDKSKVAGNAECIQYLAKYYPPAHFTPGSKYEYSNTGYMLLASIVEKVARMDFVDFVQQRIFQSIGMSNTAIRTKEDKLKLSNFAWGHIYLPEKNQFVRADSFPSSNYTIWLGNRKGPGRMSSTASDLLKWDQALYAHKFVSDNNLNEAFTPVKLTTDSISNYGFGWVVQQSKIGKVVRHGGDNPGYKTYIVRYIDANKTIIMLCNNAHKQFGELLYSIESMVGDPNQETN